jgi:hypothetical protein
MGTVIRLNNNLGKQAADWEPLVLPLWVSEVDCSPGR